MMRLLRNLSAKINQSSYHIGIIEDSLINNSLNWYSKVNWIDSHLFDKEGWFADPFIFSVNDNEIIIFAEQMVYATGRGRLVRLSINRSNYLLERVDPILELETHLSFPNIWRENGKVYVYPENYQSGKLSIWEYNGSNLVNPRALIEEPLLDPQILRINDNYFVFGVKYDTGNLEDTQEVNVWKSNNLFGPYIHFQTIRKQHNTERGAGSIFFECDNIIRPAQNCGGTYGKETILYMLDYDGVSFTEKEIRRLTPDLKNKYGNVLHTFNKEFGFCVLDGLCYHYPIMHKIYGRLKILK